MSSNMHYENSGLFINFDCPSCGVPVVGEIDNAAFDGLAEPVSEGIGTAISKIICTGCDEPYEAEVIAQIHGKQVNISGHPQIYPIFHDDTFDAGSDAFFQEFVPSDAYGVYEFSHNELDRIDLTTQAMSSLKQPILRMMFVQYFVILEAYLGDRLINVILEDDEKLLALVQSVAALRDSTPKLIEVAKDPGYVRKTAKNYLQEFSFHRFGDAAKLYKSVLRVDILADEETAKQLNEITIKRHHLVHRNGRDNEGKPVSVSLFNVLKLRQCSHAVVKRIEDAYQDYRSERLSKSMSENMATRKTTNRPWGKKSSDDGEVW